MKMPRSQCETGNVQFVQELAEVDGPFEAPININFRDLTKLELPSLVWNRGDACPRKMKITNTGHTVIVSGKWKSERPYLTGGPLLGKYVFSQIHFHWGQTDCKGSEHQICGEEFPLEMHVAHFKTEYMTQECALREKDGMVVVVYLFKLQEEPNHSLKKIINSLPRVKQPSTSQAIDPRPILSFCNPFTDDYFMYWGSVVTSTCAHILLWIICREPFGISKEQVNEFRKIMDSSQQPICKNSRDVQPLHKRNVFHVNASKHLDDPLLPIKKILGCYCKESKDAFNAENSDKCHCHGAFQNQEDVEGCATENRCSDVEGMPTMHSCFANQTFFVQTATVESLSIVLKRPESDPIKNQCSILNIKKIKSEAYNQQVKLVSKSCCFFPKLETKKRNSLIEKRRIREKRKRFNSMKAFSQIMHSLEALKNHTFKKLKKIESINQEIKEMKPFCQDTEDKRWIRKIEKMITRQKQFTIKSSQGCLSELKKLAKDCNFDKYFDAKALPAGDNEQKMVWLTNSVIASTEPPCCDIRYEDEEIHGIENQPSKNSDIGKAIRFSAEAQKLIESFFEDIKESEDLHETMKKDMNLKKIESICSVEGDSKSLLIKSKGYITQKMFNLGNLGDRFFTEVTTEEMDLDENWEDEAQNEDLTTTQDVSETKNTSDSCEKEKSTETVEANLESNAVSVSKNEDIIPLHRANIAILLPKADEAEAPKTLDILTQDAPFKDENNLKFSLKKTSKKIHLKKSVSDEEELYELTDEKLTRAHEAKVAPSNSQNSSSTLSTESTENQRVITKKAQKSEKDFSEHSMQKSFVVFKISSKKLHNKVSCKRFENMQKKNLKNKKRKNYKGANARYKNLCGLSSTSKEEANVVMNKSKWKKVTKAKPKLETEKQGVSTEESVVESTLISPERKKLKLECKKPTAQTLKEDTITITNNVHLTATETRTLLTNSLTKHQKTAHAKIKPENFKKEESAQKILKENFSEERQSITFESTENESRTISKTFTNKTYRASSVDSKTSYSKTTAPKEFEDNKFNRQLSNSNKTKEIPKFLEGRPLSKMCRSLTNISTTPKMDFTQRLHLESIDNRKKSNKDAFVTRINLESQQKFKESSKFTKDFPREASNEIEKDPKQEYDEQEHKDTNRASEGQKKLETKTQNKSEYDSEFLTEASSQMDDEFLLKDQVEDEKEKKVTVKRCTERKFQLLEKETNEIKEDHFEVLRPTDSDTSFARNASKGDADFLITDNKNFQTSVSCSTLKKNSTNRAHSAETLHSLKKTFKRKGKKRPNCCKRNSRHYIRKNYSSFKKPSKPLNLLSLTDEEQLKIISANVAKYLKQKLMDEKSQPEAEKESTNNAGEEFRKINISEEKLKETPAQRSSTVNLSKTKKLKIPVLKPIKRTNEKEKEKHMKNIKQSITVESQSEAAKKKSALASSPRPVNNFIKLNKQKAGTYKRLTPTNLSKIESKEKEKLNLEKKPTSEIPRPKIRIPKKHKEQCIAPPQKPKEEPNFRPQTPSPSIVQVPSPKGVFQKDKRIKGPKTSKKPDSNTKTIKDSNTANKELATPKAEKTNEGVSAKLKPDSEKNPPPSANPKETSQTKECLDSSSTLNSNSASSKLVEDIDKKNFQHEVVKCDATGNMEEVSKSEALFKKELEYFITMQMYLNNEISKGIESPLNYFKSKLLSSDYKMTESPSAIDSLQNLDFSNKDVVVVQKKNLEECSSSCSELCEISTKCCQEKGSTDGKNEDSPKSKKILTVKTPTNFSDRPLINPKPVREGSEDSPSDSSYDCKISITLNTNLNTKETENERQSHDRYCLEENFNSQTTTSLEESSSQQTEVKLQNKKRKESEMSLEMKQKLLEILEGEIKREIGISCGISSENSSDDFAFKAGDSEGNLRSQSTESSSDNIEALAQISNTMKQYLTYLKEIKRLPNESKDYDEF